MSSIKVSLGTHANRQYACAPQSLPLHTRKTAAPQQAQAPSPTDDVRFTVPADSYKMPFGPGENTVGQSPLALRAALRARSTRARAIACLGNSHPTRLQCVKLHLPNEPYIRSRELVAALQQADFQALKRLKFPAVAVFDFDNTLMAGDVFGEFAELLVQTRCLKPEANPPLAKLMGSMGLPGLSEAELLRRDVNDNLETALTLMMARERGAPAESSIAISEMFFILAAAMKGLTPAIAGELAHKLYEDGVAGRAPYRTHVFDPSPHPYDSAQNIVEVLQDKGIECHIVTAGLRLLAQAGAKYLGIANRHVVGAELETQDGVYTGRVSSVVDIGKPALVQRNIAPAPLFAFGDSPSTDGPMLKLALIQGFMVDPQPAFIEMAKRENQHFMTLSFKKPGHTNAL